MYRILVGGISGSGKSTLAAAVSARLAIPYHELDALHHGPGWTKRDSFEDEVHAFAGEPVWICDDQYHRFLGDLLWERADTILWLDLPRHIVITRVVRRSLIRIITRRALWSGNRETWRQLVCDPTHPVRWAWTQHGVRRNETVTRIADHPHVRVVRLTSPREVRRWLGALPSRSAPRVSGPSAEGRRAVEFPYGS
ncbi:AAA family ATPase [Nocardia sp. NPDC088792]|uniref:AAA family ATPase n=1 Tax=Nocardia sp. NPDC088792 TaxID=3364332 RepID=UPI0037F1E0B2